MSAPTLITPYGYSSSTCGYCSPSGERSAGPSSKKFGVEGSQMSVKFYQDMIDRGWRRSGTYVYHPDMARTCCPQYTIRLDVSSFKPGKKQRGVVNRFNRFLSTGARPGVDASGASDGAAGGEGSAQGKGKSKEKGKVEFDFMQELRTYQHGYGEDGAHRFETELTPAKPTAETFALYKKYQVSVHKDAANKVFMRGFDRFLCSSPLLPRKVKYNSDSPGPGLPREYGSYHLLYRVDGKLIGISVLDILPSCVSSVYFIWDPDWAWASLGKLSALMEVALAIDMKRAGAAGMEWLYMGYWIADCVKMRYKSEYAPSYLLDPGTNEFHSLTPRLDKYLQSHPRGYHPFLEIAALPDTVIQALKPAAQNQGTDVDMHDDDEEDDESDVEQLDEWPEPPPPGFERVQEEGCDDVVVFATPRGKAQLIPYGVFAGMLLPHGQKQAVQTVAALGSLMARTSTPPETLIDCAMLYFDM